MPYTLIVREEAVEEVKHAYLYYERIRDGLGERFLSELRKRYSELLNIHCPTALLIVKNQPAI